jgi:glutathione S-transferase
MKLYSFSGSCGLAANIVLEWIGEPFDVELLEKEALSSPAYLAKNPNGQVPMLEDGDFILTQNAAVMDYLSNKYPDAKLCGEDNLQQRARVHQWLSFINSDVHPAFKPLFGTTAYLQDPAMIDKSKEDARQRLTKFFGRINEQLAGKEYLVGSRSIADAYLFVVARWAEAVKVDCSGFDHIADFVQRMHADSAVQKALASQKLS